MGDIIAGSIITLFSIALIFLYRYVASQTGLKKSFTGFLSFLMIFGAALGMLVSCFEDYLRNEPFLFVLVLLFFGVQAAAGFLHLKARRLGLVLVLMSLTLALQILSWRGLHYSYRNQTLFALTLGEHPGTSKPDLEPGSYIHFFHTDAHQASKLRLGLNLIPIVLIGIYWLDRKRANVRSSKS